MVQSFLIKLYTNFAESILSSTFGLNGKLYSKFGFAEKTGNNALALLRKKQHFESSSSNENERVVKMHYAMALVSIFAAGMFWKHFSFDPLSRGPCLKSTKIKNSALMKLIQK